MFIYLLRICLIKIPAKFEKNSRKFFFRCFFVEGPPSLSPVNTTSVGPHECCFVLLQPTAMLYRVPRVFPNNGGGCERGSVLLPPSSLQTAAECTLVTVLVSGVESAVQLTRIHDIHQDAPILVLHYASRNLSRACPFFSSPSLRQSSRNTVRCEWCCFRSIERRR